MEIPTLQVIKNGNVLFESEGRWLHPLFDLEDHLLSHPLDLASCEIVDKVVGKAAAILMVRLGVEHVHTKVLSKLGQAVFERASIPFTYDTLVERIDCQTEDILREVDDAEKAYEILKKRAKR